MGAIAPFGGGFSAQVDGGYQRVRGVNLYDVAGAACIDKAQGRVGVNVGYSRIDAGGGTTISATNYGVYGEYYLNQQVTLGLRGGGDTVSVTGASRTGGYVGGETVAYVAPDIALSATGGYVDVSGQLQRHDRVWRLPAFYGPAQGDDAHGQVSSQRLWPLRHARRYLGLVRGRLEQDLRGRAGGRNALP